VAEAQTELAESGDGLTFDLPVDPEMMAEWGDLARAFDLDADTALELLGCAMVLLDNAHDAYVDELGDNFYVATRGMERDLDALIDDEYGRWSAETMQVVDKTATVGMAQIFPEVPEGMTTPVPVVYLPEIIEEAEDEEARDA